MKKIIVMMSYVLICLLAPFFNSCNEEDWLLSTPEKEKPQYFSKNGLGFAYLGLTLNGDTIVYLEVRLKETTIPVAPERLLVASLLKDLPIQKNESTGNITAHQTFISDDGQETYLSLRAKAPEYLLELVKIQTGYQDYRFEWADPTPTPIGDMAMLTEHITPMLLDENGNSLGDIPALEPWYYHTTTVKPDEPEPHIPVIEADTAYFWIGLDAFWRFRGTIDGVVFHEAVYPIASTGTFNGTDLWRLEAPARFDTSVGNNGLETSVEPQPGLSYTDQKVDEYTKATKECGYFHVKSTFIGDGQGTTTTECGIVYWTMSYTITEPTTGWTMSTHPIELTHEVTRNELTIVDGSRNDKYGKPHHHIGDLTTQLTSYLIINNEKHVFYVSSDVSHLCEWAQP